MKVSIGSKIVEGPYGGGNLFVKNLSSYLLKKGNSVVYDLKDKDIDIILIINPLKNSESATFDHLDALFYTKFVNEESIIVQRINECDERKNTNNVNTQIIKANQFVDYTIYVSEWISDLFKKKGLESKNSKVILSGSDNKIFNQKEKEYWDRKSKFKIVTHHWSPNWMKGFDSYKIIDDLLDYKSIENETGKKIGNDFEEGKVTLPIILAFHRGDKEERNFWKRTIQNGSKKVGDMEKACHYLNKRNVLNDIVDRAKYYGMVAKDALEIFPNKKEY